MEDIKLPTNEANTLTSLIPEFFYVLIGRAIPGCLFIIGLVYALDKTIIFELLLNVSITSKEPDTVLKFDPPYTLIFILLLILSYASGLMLSVIGDWLGKHYIYLQYREKLFEFPCIIKMLLGLAKIKKVIPPEDLENWQTTGRKFCQGFSPQECGILFQRQHDYVKQEYAHQARSLSESAAEVQLCINTSAAYLLLFLFQILIIIFQISRVPCSIFQVLSKPFFIFQISSINFFNFVYEFSQRWFLIIVYAAIAIISYFAAKYRNKRFLMRQFSFSVEIKKREDEAENSKCTRCFNAMFRNFSPPSASS
ncbi:MAG: hypothetical protein NT166_23060 [Candidatus Aminicenantes bacterium]|nr:hypothetical protein [Candidatus Aminicenantes bacterium]